MGCVGTKTLLVLTDDTYIEITRDLIISENEVDRVDKISRSTFRVLQMVQNRKLYSKKDRKRIDKLYCDVQAKQLKEEERRERQKSISELYERRENSDLSISRIYQRERMRKAKNRNITW